MKHYLAVTFPFSLKVGLVAGLGLFVACAKRPSDDAFFDAAPVSNGGESTTGGNGGQAVSSNDMSGAGTGGTGGTGGTSSAGGDAGTTSVAGGGGSTAGGGGSSGGNAGVGGVAETAGGAGGSEGCTQTFADHCYQYFGTVATFDAAKAACEALGAHLVTISSGDENTFVWNLSGDEQWIGASDGKDQYDNEVGTYTWVTSETWDYENWSEGQPNAVETDCPGDPNCYEHCAFQWDAGAWNDRYCGHEIPYVCEFE